MSYVELQSDSFAYALEVELFVGGKGVYEGGDDHGQNFSLLV